MNSVSTTNVSETDNDFDRPSGTGLSASPLMVAFGLPFWLFIVPAIGYPLLIIWAVLVNTDIVRSVRWRRQYELGIDRLIQTSLFVAPKPEGLENSAQG